MYIMYTGMYTIDSDLHASSVSDALFNRIKTL